MSIGNNILKYRVMADLTQEDVAKHIKVSPQAVYKYEKGIVTNIPIDKILLMAELFGVSPSDLTGWDENPPASQLPPGCYPIDPSKMHRIPILGRVAAGMPLYAEENIEGYTYTELNGGAEYFALRVKGDSMTAVRIHDQDIVIVRRQSMVDDGQIAIVIVDDENATMKRFYRIDNTVTLMPQSTNPDHKPQIYDLTKTKVEIIGRVVKLEVMF